MPAGLVEGLPTHRQERFLAVWLAHEASYFVGLVGGALLCFRIWQARGRPSIIEFFPQTRNAAVRRGLIAALAAWIAWLRFYAS